jgi:hypothetical protein
VLEKISTISNRMNSSLIQEFNQFIADNRKSYSYKKNNLKALILFSRKLAPTVTFYDIQKITLILGIYSPVKFLKYTEKIIFYNLNILD